MKYICDSCEKYPCDDTEIKLMKYCPVYSPKPKPQTNADRIRAMTDEELAELIGDNINCFVCEKVVFEVSKCPGSMTVGRYCHDVWLNWLKKQAEDGDT